MARNTVIMLFHFSKPSNFPILFYMQKSIYYSWYQNNKLKRLGLVFVESGIIIGAKEGHVSVVSAVVSFLICFLCSIACYMCKISASIMLLIYRCPHFKTSGTRIMKLFRAYIFAFAGNACSTHPAYIFYHRRRMSFLPPLGELPCPPPRRHPGKSAREVPKPCYALCAPLMFSS